MPSYFTLHEFHSSGKHPDQSLNEDFLFIGQDLVAVIDGATAKSSLEWAGSSSGHFAGKCLWHALLTLDPDLDARGAVTHLSNALNKAFIGCGRLDLVTESPPERPTAAIIVLNVRRRELWLVGDCHALVNGRHVENFKLIDSVNANARALALEQALLKGKTVAELLEDDIGKKFVWPLVTDQLLFQNKPETGEFWYSAIDGFQVPDAGIKVVSLPDERLDIVLASDGYPELQPSLLEAEANIAELIKEDPLCFRRNKSVKGLAPGHLSFDDRTFVRVTLSRNSSFKTD